MSRNRVIVLVGLLAAFLIVGALVVFAQPAGAPREQSFALRVSGSTMTPSTIEVYRDDTVAIAIASDTEQDVHLHGYDIHFLVAPTATVTKTFKADKEGAFDIEVEETGKLLGKLQVAPRGLGLFDFFTKKPSPSPAAHAGLHHHHGGTAQEKATASYTVLLHFGPVEPMYTQSEVDAGHYKTGELILRGDKPPAITEGRHIGTHVFKRNTGKVVTNAFPTITVTDSTAGVTVAMPVVMMEALDVGASDLHYGNNIALPAGHAVRIIWTLDGETVEFSVTS